MAVHDRSKSTTTDDDATVVADLATLDEYCEAVGTKSMAAIATGAHSHSIVD